MRGDTNTPTTTASLPADRPEAARPLDLSLGMIGNVGSGGGLSEVRSAARRLIEVADVRGPVVACDDKFVKNGSGA